MACLVRGCLRLPESSKGGCLGPIRGLRISVKSNDRGDRDFTLDLKYSLSRLGLYVLKSTNAMVLIEQSMQSPDGKEWSVFACALDW